MTPIPLIRARSLRSRVRTLAQRICADHRTGTLVLLVIMDGAFCFVADLVRSIDLPDVRLHFVRASSYGGGTVSRGQVDLGAIPDLGGQQVVVADDILDTGRTLARVVAACGSARSVRTCVLLDKPARRASDGLAAADYVGFTIADAFVVGYGLDHDGRYRHLPDVCVLAPAPALPTS
jgi:hypoxanthine phosphoribosyltransferase